MKCLLQENPVKLIRYFLWLVIEIYDCFVEPYSSNMYWINIVIELFSDICYAIQTNKKVVMLTAQLSAG